jgi:hypothetical protein
MSQIYIKTPKIQPSGLALGGRAGLLPAPKSGSQIQSKSQKWGGENPLNPGILYPAELYFQWYSQLYIQWYIQTAEGQGGKKQIER